MNRTKNREIEYIKKRVPLREEPGGNWTPMTEEEWSNMQDKHWNELSKLLKRIQ